MDLAQNLAQITIIDEPGECFSLPVFKCDVHCNTDNETMVANVLSAVARNLPTVSAVPPHERVAIIAGGGPSLKDGLEDLRRAKAAGVDIYALNGASKFLAEQGITPDFQVILDPRPTNVSLLGGADQVLLASQCAPELFDAAGELVEVFHVAGSAYGKVTGDCIGGDVTAGLAAMCLLHTMGYRDVHLYGYDSSFASSFDDEGFHAYPQELSGQEGLFLEIHINDQFGSPQIFRTNYAMAKQAELFPKVAKMIVEDGCRLEVHGTGLLPTIARAMASHRLPQAAE